MNFDNLSGKWKGQYTYLKGYSDNVIGISTTFEISWEVSNGKIEGTCWDENAPQFFKQGATIKGEIKEDSLIFIKTYPSAYYVDDTGESFLVPDEPSHEIIYEALLTDKSASQLGGKWEIKQYYLDSLGTLCEYVSGGSWLMKKCETSSKKPFSLARKIINSFLRFLFGHI